MFKVKDNMLNQVKFLEFPQLGDDRGHLVVIEGNQTIPFDIKRIFYIYGSDKDVVRGQHANINSEFVLINVNGTSKVRVSDGKEEKIYELNQQHTGIYLPKLVWKDMYDFSDDSVLLVLSNEHYDGNEYLRDYNEYLDYINNLVSETK